jgi:hypothetical protein
MYVETIPRQGYSFVGRVTPSVASLAARNGNSSSGDAAQKETHSETSKGLTGAEMGRPSSWFIAGVVSLVLAGMLFGAATILYLHRAV